MKHLQLKGGDRLRRQCIGVDIPKKKFTFCLCQSTEQDLHFYTKPKEFENSESGFRHLLEWSGNEVDSSVPYSFLMETTGCYHESLAIFLARKGLTVFVVHANKAKNFARLSGQRTKTDLVDSKMLATMGCDTVNLKAWPLPEEKYLHLREMSRLSEQLEKTRTQVLGRMEAVTHSGFVDKSVLHKHKALLKSVDRLQSANEKEMDELVDGDTVLCLGVRNMDSIKCVGRRTAVLVVAETLGFHQMTSAKQVASYAGLDVKKEQSGVTDKKGHMTKRGTETSLPDVLHLEERQAVGSEIWSGKQTGGGNVMKASTRKLIEKLARDVKRGDEICDYNPVFTEIFGGLFLELEQCLSIIPYLEATPARHPMEFGDPRVIQDLNDFWMKRNPFEDVVYDPHQSDEE